MIAVTDVHYSGARATAAVVVAAAWTDARAVVERVVDAEVSAEYTPGELYRRELPPLLAALAALPSLPAIILVDGHAWLGPDRPGLGVHLHRALDGRAAVVGVAKSEFAGATAIPVRRGTSARPLWVSAIGIDAGLAAAEVARMHGPNRLPVLLLRADHLARGLAAPSEPGDRARNVKTPPPAAATVTSSTMSATATRLLPLLGHVQQHLDRDLSLRALAARVRRSPFELHRAFRRLVGETTKQYTLRLRLDRAAAELLSGRGTVLEVALATGFASHEVFTRAFRRRFGMSPSAYRERGLAGPRDRLAGHAATVRDTAPCIGLYHLDAQEEPRRTEMTVEVTRRELAPQAALVIRRRIQATEIAATLAEILPRVFAHAQRAAIPMAGPPFVRYLEMGRGLITLEGGMPIAAPAGREGDIEPALLPGGTAAYAVHVGQYEKLAETHAAIEAWIEAEGERAGGPPWESYVTDPADHPDPADWRTEVFWPLAR